MNEEETQLTEAAAGVDEGNNIAEQQQQAAETARSKALARARGRNAERTFADDDDEALWGAVNEDAEADAAELDAYRKDSEDFNNFLSGNKRGAGLLASIKKNGNPVGYFAREYGKDMVESLADPEVQAQVEASEQKRLEEMAKDDELQQQREANKEKSREVRQAMIDEGYSEEEVDNTIKQIIDRAVRNLMGEISREDIEGVINLGKREADLAEAEGRGEIKGRNANIASEIQKRRKATDGLPSLTNTGGTPKSSEKKDNTGALGAVADRRSVWE